MPDGRLAVDPTGRVAGRGAYLCADGSCWRQALARGAVSRALGVPLSDEVRSVLARGPADAAIEIGADATTMNSDRGAANGEE